MSRSNPMTKAPGTVGKGYRFLVVTTVAVRAGLYLKFGARTRRPDADVAGGIYSHQLFPPDVP
jgi:hypothetical protein